MAGWQAPGGDNPGRALRPQPTLSTLPPDARATRRSIRLMVLAMASFIINDALVKVASQTLPTGQLILVRGLMATALVLVVMRVGGTPLRPAGLVRGWVAARAAIDALATLMFLVSLFHLPLANATAINMATPLVVTLLAIFTLGERVGARRWLAIGAGFAGVLMVIQPGPQGFNGYAWLCLAGTLVNAVRDTITRRIAPDVPSITVTLATSVAVTLLAGALAAGQQWAPMGLREWGLLAAAAVFLATGYQLIIRATRSGELSVVAPFRYSGLLMAVLIGWVVWGDVPNLLAWAGIALLVTAGWYLMRSGRVGQGR